MNRILRNSYYLMLFFCPIVGAVAQLSLPLEFRQNDTTFNLQSQLGVPISTTVGVPPGSDGRMPTDNESGSVFLPTALQFRGAVSFGAIPGLTLANWQTVSNSAILNMGTTPFSSTVASHMMLPLGLDGNEIVVVLRRAQIGAPYLSRQVSFFLGSVVTVPATDENGLSLEHPSEYWQPEPQTDNNHVGEGYYWSPHAGKVYATQPGPISISWKRREFQSATNSTCPENFVFEGGNCFRIFTEKYIVSGSPVKPPRKIYWTERSSGALGKLVAIPDDVGVVIAYNNNFPATVAEPIILPGDESFPPNPVNDIKTLWYDGVDKSLHAQNREGRVFLELLGDDTSSTTRKQLGFEIVDIFRRPTPRDVTIELGERLIPPLPGVLEELFPEPVLQTTLATPPFAYEHNVSERELYAARETINVNDYLVHWMEEGEQGILWPELFARYNLIWPTDMTKYSHYVRPLVDTENEAKETAIPMPTVNVPRIQYQDPLDKPRAKLTETFAFYTWLDEAYPVHRTLLLFSSGDNIVFERVFSWLDVGLNNPSNYANNPIVENLDAWNPTTEMFDLPGGLVLQAPRVVNETVDVGRRIVPPSDEQVQCVVESGCLDEACALEAGCLDNDQCAIAAGCIDDDCTIDNNCLVGSIRSGTSFNPHAYADPFVFGFDLSRQGSIIPVNAIPNKNQLEIWWYRPNGADATQGFSTIYWPSVIGHYTIQWPNNPREIVLASNLGSEGNGPLDSFEANGTIYYQNDPSLPGHNPNEEHAIASGGTVFATRDDLNITSGEDYSSDPFVLLEFPDADGRPSMSVFKVLREKSIQGWVFDYITEAGSLLQAPMPLPLLAKPVEGSGDNAINYNTEPTDQPGDLPVGWQASDATGPFGHYNRFTYRDRKDDFWVYRGVHTGLPVLQAGRYNPTTMTFEAPPSAIAIVNQPFTYVIHASRQSEFLQLTSDNLPSGLSVSGLSLIGTPTSQGSSTVNLTIQDLYQGNSVTIDLTINVKADGDRIGCDDSSCQNSVCSIDDYCCNTEWDHICADEAVDFCGNLCAGPFETSDCCLQSGTGSALGPHGLISDNSYTGTSTVFNDRPPFLAVSPTPSNSFTMRYYYKTEPSFAWPGNASPPPPGSIVPYLRPMDSSGDFIGDPASKNTAALDIVYRPVWPERDPKDSSKPVATMPYGLTLVKPQLGLPGIGAWSTAQVLYQQSIAAGITNPIPTVVLHDPTREKVSDLEAQALTDIPGSVRSEFFQGKRFFPNLPPHLADRVFFDPNRGSKGSLVLAGEFKDETFGEDYLLLNVLRGSDLQAVKDLCPASDTENFPTWNTLVDALATTIETFHENPDVPGTFVPDPVLNEVVGVQDLAEIDNDRIAVDSYALSASGPGSGYITLIEADGEPFTQPGDPVAMHVLRVVSDLHVGELKVIPNANPLSEQVTFQHTPDLAGRFDEYEYEWKIAAPVDGQPPITDATMSRYLALSSGTDQPRYLLGGSGIQVLGDNYIVLRYKPVNPNHPLFDQWSEWTNPQLAEGWIKRVLAGINPFNQRIDDLFNNEVNTDVSLLTQAGTRWEGDIALNIDNIDDFGLIEIYETVLRRGKSISIESGFNYGPANDALLLAAGYINDLYMFVGNEAFADAANPTIGIGTADNTYGDIATALFSFRGQLTTLLDEELTLLRGRDDFLVPGVEISPIYNRLVWNYTRGIDAGEVIYALNYNIQEDPNRTPDGVIDAEDAAVMFPQGHGDAYGHYLTALKGYYSLLMNQNFDWVPRSEAVLVLGQPVSVDYQDERKFAAAAASLARTGRQVFDLTWRKDFHGIDQNRWDHFSETRENDQRNTTRYWGMDHWASRVGQGNYFNWVVGNAILPDEDPNPDHEGIQKIDRTTVPELLEIVVAEEGLQTAMDQAEAGLNPLGLSENAIAFDLNPNVILGSDGGTHFEQIYQRAKVALNNAVVSFDDAKDVTRLMRSEQDSLADFQNVVAKQELAFENSLIERYGTPYPDDIGPGKTWQQGYEGPDLIHYAYVDLPEHTIPSVWNYMGDQTEFQIDIQDHPPTWITNFFLTDLDIVSGSSNSYTEGSHYINFNVDAHGFSNKPSDWTGKRASPGKIQQAISRVIASHTALRQTLFDATGAKITLDRSIGYFEARKATHDSIRSDQELSLDAEIELENLRSTTEIAEKSIDVAKETIEHTVDAIFTAIPDNLIFGIAAGGDTLAPAQAVVLGVGYGAIAVLSSAQAISFASFRAEEAETSIEILEREFDDIAPLEWDQEVRSQVEELGNALEEIQGYLATINVRLREYDDVLREYRTLVAEGERIQRERLIFRQRASAIIQGFRTRDAAFRIFRNEKLERYKTLFDLAARYSYLAATAYDYETGLLGTSQGQSFINRIIASRALGIVSGGEPQFAGSNTGDPGLSSVLAEMKADWDVIRGRLGFNNPDAYGTTTSLRTENYRILPTTASDVDWKNILQNHRMPDLLADADVRRNCLQIANSDGLPVQGIIIEFSTTIEDGYNLFGRQLAGGDHAFSPSSFATKIFGVGIAFPGYVGMDEPSANSGSGGTSPTDPDLSFLDPTTMAATPYVYLIPVGTDSMRSPPLGDANGIRSWTVDDIAIPLPFNIGLSEFASGGLTLSSETLSEPLFNIRKHQAFRPVPDSSYFSTSLYGSSGSLLRSQFTNNRLVGRSVWNSKWKLVIPGKTLHNDPDEGLNRFINSVRDIKIHFVTYSYAGN